jgi:hypothetical protein
MIIEEEEEREEKGQTLDLKQSNAMQQNRSDRQRGKQNGQQNTTPHNEP